MARSTCHRREVQRPGLDIDAARVVEGDAVAGCTGEREVAGPLLDERAGVVEDVGAVNAVENGVELPVTLAVKLPWLVSVPLLKFQCRRSSRPGSCRPAANYQIAAERLRLKLEGTLRPASEVNRRWCPCRSSRRRPNWGCH